MRTRTELERITLRQNATEESRVVPLILSATDINYPGGKVSLTVGYRGLPNRKGQLAVGDYLVFDIPNHGSFELRLASIRYAPYPYSVADISIACLVLEERAAVIESSLPAVNGQGPRATHPFTAQEKAEIRRALQAFRESIRETYSPSGEQDAAIGEELRNLSELLDNLRRRVDWKGIVISTLVNIAATLALAPDGLRQLAHLLITALKVPLGLP